MGNVTITSIIWPIGKHLTGPTIKGKYIGKNEYLIPRASWMEALLIARQYPEFKRASVYNGKRIIEVSGNEIDNA
jgi:hypothetical protein